MTLLSTWRAAFFCAETDRSATIDGDRSKNPFLACDSMTPFELDCVKKHVGPRRHFLAPLNIGPKDMNKLILSVAVVATLMMSSVVFAQRPGGGGGDGPQRGARGERGGPGGERGRGGPPQISPLMAALDADKDGKLSKEEIAGAAAALKALDKNEDGVLDTEELAPARGGRGGDGGGRQGGGGRGGDPAERVNRMFEMDADKDGKISKEEGGERMERFFGFMDGDKDGFLTREEVESAMSRFGGGRGGNRGGRGGGQAPKAKDNRPAFDDK
jgi:Ca2+-binding EF-hand superfamily protein